MCGVGLGVIPAKGSRCAEQAVLHGQVRWGQRLHLLCSPHEEAANTAGKTEAAGENSRKCTSWAATRVGEQLPALRVVSSASRGPEHPAGSLPWRTEIPALPVFLSESAGAPGYSSP